jgi:hypothetical protein
VTTALVVAGALIAVVLAAQGYVIYKFAKRLLQFDQLVEHMLNDFDSNITFLGKLLETPVLEHSEEIIDAHHGMAVMQARLMEIVQQMAELTGTVEKIREKIAKRRANPPVVVD